MLVGTVYLDDDNFIFVVAVKYPIVTKEFHADAAQACPSSPSIPVLV